MNCIVFIHGWASTPQIWQRQEEYFSKFYEVILPDISLAQDIQEAAIIVQDALKGKNNYVLVGWSLGWLVILEGLINFGWRPRGVVAVNSTAKFTDDGYLGSGPTDTHLAKMIRDCRRNPQKVYEDFYLSMLSPEGRDCFKTMCHCERSEAILGLPRHFVPRNDTKDDRLFNNLIYGLEMLKKADYREDLENINIPTLFISGKNDQICPPEASLYMHKCVKNSVLKVFDCGHLPFIAKEKEFNAAVENFIKSL